MKMKLASLISSSLLLYLLFASNQQSASAEQEIELQYEALEIIDKTPAEIIRLRGFRAQVHFARTKDGYYVHLVRIINPKNSGPEAVSKRPVLFNHGLLESSTIWLINSRNVRPTTPAECEQRFENLDSDASNSTRLNILTNSTNGNDTEAFFINGPMLLSNCGYDVWLLSMRGTDWSLRHDFLNVEDPQYWNYSLDDFALVDVPTAIRYIRIRTGAPKVGYIGHSQATFAIFGLLSSRPRYANIIEPVVAVAPVAFFDHITSMMRIVFTTILKSTGHDKNGPFPPKARFFRKTMTRFCKDHRKETICQLIDELISGSGPELTRGYHSHLPFFTSLKVLRHFGQLIESKRMSMYDYGSKDNLRLYGTMLAPSYPIDRIRSRAIALISTKSDVLSPPEDVERFKSLLTVPLFEDIHIEGQFNHMNMIVSPEAGDLVFKQILRIFEHFEQTNEIQDEANPVNEMENEPEGSIGTIRNNLNSSSTDSKKTMKPPAEDNVNTPEIKKSLGTKPGEEIKSEKIFETLPRPTIEDVTPNITESTTTRGNEINENQR